MVPNVVAFKRNEQNRTEQKNKKKIILETYSYHFVVTSNYAELSECRLKRLQQQPYFMNRGFPFGTIRPTESM